MLWSGTLYDCTMDVLRSAESILGLVRQVADARARPQMHPGDSYLLQARLTQPDPPQITLQAIRGVSHSAGFVLLERRTV